MKSGGQPVEHLALVDVQRRPELPHHAAGMKREPLIAGDPLQGLSQQCLRGRGVGGVAKVNREAGALAFDLDARQPGQLKPSHRLGGPLECGGERRRGRD